MSKITIKYNLDGTEIARFATCQEAANEIGVHKSTISKCCKGKLPQVKGFKYAVTEQDEPQPLTVKCPYCEKYFDTYNSLCKHVIAQKAHGLDITREQLLTDYAYNGERPTCACGCGGYTKIEYGGGAHFVKYIRGHASRVHNNWGHNEKAKENSAETRRQQYASGERIQWNKGKKLEETHGVDGAKLIKGKIEQALHGRIKNHKFSISSALEKDFIRCFVDPLGIEYETQYYLKDIKQYKNNF